jgi:hypothetical protein
MPMSLSHARQHASLGPTATSKPAKRLAGLTVGLMLAAGLAGASVPVSAAEAAGLEGTWSGGSTVRFASGAEEHARCRAHYSRRSQAVYVLRATCATASGKAAQSATLQKVGDNRYSGTFYNSEFDISGRIYVILRGSSQSVRLTSGSGSASFRLSR